jgi:hypothetical protein
MGRNVRHRHILLLASATQGLDAHQACCIEPLFSEKHQDFCIAGRCVLELLCQ